jgi:hypothetical protein
MDTANSLKVWPPRSSQSHLVRAIALSQSSATGKTFSYDLEDVLTSSQRCETFEQVLEEHRAYRWRREQRVSPRHSRRLKHCRLFTTDFKTSHDNQDLRLTKQDQRQFQTSTALAQPLLRVSETDLYSRSQIVKDLPAHHNVSQHAATCSTRTINSSRLPPPIMEDLTLCSNNVPSSSRRQWIRDGSVFVLLLFTRVIESEQMSRSP